MSNKAQARKFVWEEDDLEIENQPKSNDVEVLSKDNTPAEPLRTLNIDVQDSVIHPRLRSFLEVTTNVRRHTKRSKKTGKAWNVVAHDREIIFYRGTVPGETKRIAEPFTAALGKTFVARTVKGAQSYGSSIEKFTALPGSKILYDDDQAFWKLIGRRRPPNDYIGSVLRKGETLVSLVNDAVKKAEAAGYDAISIGDADIGTVILNNKAFKREKLAEAIIQERTTWVRGHDRYKERGHEYVHPYPRQIVEVDNIEKTKRQFLGKEINTKLRYSKTMLGKLGEALTMKSLGGIAVNEYLGIKKNNLPYDVINVRKGILYEVKAGAISNKKDDRKWRLTKGEPSELEKKWLKNAPADLKRLYHSDKEGMILARKKIMKREIEKMTGKKFKVRTITYVVNPDTQSADQYVIDGLHPIIRWHWPVATKNYKRSLKWK